MPKPRTKIEDVARAQWDDYRKSDPDAIRRILEYEWDELITVSKQWDHPFNLQARRILLAGRRQARVAIVALREPTESMENAEFDTPENRLPITMEEAINIWYSMIDVILAE